MMGKKGKKRKHDSEEKVAFDSDNEFVLSDYLKNEIESMWEVKFLKTNKKSNGNFKNLLKIF